MKKIRLLLLICVVTQTITAQNLNGLKISSKVSNAQKIKTFRLNYQTVAEDIPTNYSLKKYVPNVGNQGNHGTCVGWSTGYYAMSIINSVNQNIINKTTITNKAMSPIYPYIKAKKVAGDFFFDCEDGTFISYALKSIKDYGIPYKKDFEVMCATEIPNGLNVQLKLKDFTNLVSSNLTNSQKTTNIKSSLAVNYPVLIGVGLDNNFRNISKNNPVYVPDNTKQVIGFHAMTIIGYDDNKFGGAFEVVNSWDKDWGNNGYFWIRYNDLYAKDGDCWMYDDKGNVINIRNGDGDIVVYDAIPEAVKKTTEEVSIKTKLVLTPLNTEINLLGNFIHSNLKYGEQIVVNDESIKMYSTVESHSKNTKYKIKLEIGKPLYVYVLYSDSNNQNGIIFPNISMNESALLSNSTEEIILPTPRSSFKLIGDVSSDYSIILFSSQKLNPKRIITKINESKEQSISNKLYGVLHSKLIKKNEFNLNGNNISGKVKLKEGEIACIIVNIKRKQ